MAPGISLPTLVALWSVYALVDGVFNLATAAWAARAGRSWRWMLVEGGASSDVLYEMEDGRLRPSELARAHGG